MPGPSSLPSSPRSSLAPTTSGWSPSGGYSGISSSTEFSKATRAAVTAMTGDKCWTCYGPNPQVCHVMAFEDEQAGLWSEKGLMNFSINSSKNAIPLCASCHVQFSMALDPGLIIIPTDLDYFIQFELKDQQHRKIAADGGVRLEREVPTPESYRLHQIGKGIIGADAIGGQYVPVFLKHYLMVPFPHETLRSTATPREWGGSPLACLRRCFHMLGSARLSFLDKEKRLKLERLRNLYFLDTEEEYLESAVSPFQDTAAQPKPNRGKKRQLTDEAPEKPQSPKRQTIAKRGRIKRQSRDINQRCPVVESVYCPILRREVRAYWNFGPDFTTEDVVQRIGPYIGGGLDLMYIWIA